MNNYPLHSATGWVKSTYSNGDGGDCLEWAPAAARRSGTVPVRDSKTPYGPVLAIPAHHWSSFVTAVKHGELRAP
ncbi:hypothetical protein GCM10018793_47920 [Streptomyces sulfonofaciens]|uniref:DUF397 domain-containing protein n=1 Tax=Streptomyces sulfonofaciens TaxID=68272 RepID=A0A919L689_9ACTN|nr:DUF397 domain-containing protein [Streptomyces sulfonofaciens]GHH84191.1 hypothetical protein GCM10018793_47920 [Streptomyces sulfonofaciens]